MNHNKKSLQLISSETRNFVHEAWEAQNGRVLDFLHSFIYARWPYHYIGVGNGKYPIFKKVRTLVQAWGKLFPKEKLEEAFPHPSLTQKTGTVADFYHGKVMPLKSAQELVMVDEPINLPDLEQVIPYVQARAIIQENPDHILLMQCPCRSAKEEPCQPLDVCMVVGEPFVAFTHKYYSSLGRRITQEEAFEILEREDARGRVHHAFFTQMMLGRFFAICNCCACCCVAMKNHHKGVPMLISSGYVSQIDADLCTACGLCPEEYCQFKALEMRDGICFITEEKCMGCGICVSKCPHDAISLQREPAKGEPLEIKRLLKEAAV